MKKLSGLLFFVALIIGAAGIQSRVRAQDDPIVGEYRDMSVRSKEALKNARFAVSARAKKSGHKIELVKLVAAMEQIVAGTNYKLCLTVREDGKKRKVGVVVYKNLKNKRSLTRWSRGDCR